MSYTLNPKPSTLCSQSVEDSVCCMQSQYFTLDIGRGKIKENAVVLKLIAGSRMERQSPLRLSASYSPCSDDGAFAQLSPSTNQVSKP